MYKRCMMGHDGSNETHKRLRLAAARIKVPQARWTKRRYVLVRKTVQGITKQRGLQGLGGWVRCEQMAW